MDFWFAIVIIVALGTISSMYFAKLNSQKESGDRVSNDMEARVADIEKRISNIESVLIELKKEQRFNELRD